MSRILVVDDENSIRRLLEDVLGSNGYECEAVASAPEAIERIEHASFDLVIMDQNMPVMTGTDAVKRLRINPKYKKLPILMCTSAPVDNVGADAQIKKPIDLQNFLEIVASLVSQTGSKP